PRRRLKGSGVVARSAFSFWTDRATTPDPFSKAEHAVARVGERGVQRAGDRDRQGVSRVDGVEEAVVPHLGRAVVRARASRVLLEDRLANRGDLLYRERAALPLELADLHFRQHA